LSAPCFWESRAPKFRFLTTAGAELLSLFLSDECTRGKKAARQRGSLPNLSYFLDLVYFDLFQINQKLVIYYDFSYGHTEVAVISIDIISKM